ncbi:MAG TPA: dockerin type I domain-containing protein, partial [Humisphaera sp.]|nr:dockerin type I domain-containing protein [Humisphaera sp.]
NTGSPRWDGNGIASSTLLGASVDLLHSVGVADNATLGLAAHTSFAGQLVNQASILVGYALTGDSNMDGTVNILDMQNLMSGYGQPGSWQQGDFNHDGQVNILDVQQIDQNYGQTLSQIG